MPNTRKRDRAAAAVFAALGDSTRLALLARLYAGEQKSITQLHSGSALTRQAVTKHLRVLERAGVVRCERAGRESLFAFVPEPLSALQEYLSRASSEWDARLSRLKAMVEDDETRPPRR